MIKDLASFMKDPAKSDILQADGGALPSPHSDEVQSIEITHDGAVLVSGAACPVWHRKLCVLFGKQQHQVNTAL